MARVCQMSEKCSRRCVDKYREVSPVGPLTFSDIYIILHNVALYVLMSVLAS